MLLLDGRVIVVGGSGKSEYQASVEVWNPADGAWSPLARMVAGRSIHTASLLPDGRLFIVGGIGLNVVGGVETHRNPEIYDFETDEWHLTSEMNIARSGHTLSELPAGQLFLTGGTDDLGSTPPPRYTIRAPRRGPRSVRCRSLDYRIRQLFLTMAGCLVTGGFTGAESLSLMEIFTP